MTMWRFGLIFTHARSYGKVWHPAVVLPSHHPSAEIDFFYSAGAFNKITDGIFVCRLVVKKSFNLPNFPPRFLLRLLLTARPDSRNCQRGNYCCNIWRLESKYWSFTGRQSLFYSIQRVFALVSMLEKARNIRSLGSLDACDDLAYMCSLILTADLDLGACV